MSTSSSYFENDLNNLNTVPKKFLLVIINLKLEGRPITEWMTTFNIIEWPGIRYEDLYS